MLIGDKFKIESDGKLNLIVYQKRTTKKGAEIWAVMGYFGNLGNALESLTEHELKEADWKDVRQVLARLDDVYNEIKGAGLKGLTVAELAKALKPTKTRKVKDD